MKLYLKKFLDFLKNNIYRLFFAEITWSKKEYTKWEEALKDSKGYNDDIIINKVYEAALQVVNGKASFERDGAIFKNKEYCYEILSSFLYYINKQKKIKVADIGGSLGSMYFQYKEILEEKTETLCWEIFEQENFVKKGNQSFRDKNLIFSELKNIKNHDNYDIAIFGSVLNYLKDYTKIFNEFCKISNCIIVDRTSFDLEKKIRIQKIKKFPYASSYPHIIFPKKELETILNENNFKIIFEWSSISVIGAPFKFEGFMAIKK